MGACWNGVTPSLWPTLARLRPSALHTIVAGAVGATPLA